MNETLKTMLSRRSIRAFLPEAVPQPLLDEIINAGLYAPSGMGRQSTVILAVTDKALRDELMQMNAKIMGREGTDPFYGAPCVLVVLADRSAPTYLYDGALTMGNLMLAAHALRLGSCWIHRAKEEFDSPRGKEILKQYGIAGDYEGIGHCILGYAAQTPQPAERKEGRVFYAKENTK